MIGENPYYHRGPIRDARHFYGRARETALALQMVKNRQSVSVIGPRRIGKTSLLFHLADPTIRFESGLCSRHFDSLECVWYAWRPREKKKASRL